MRNGLPGYSHRFDRASNIFQFAPCFIVHSLHNDITTRDAFWSDDYEVRRGNIRSLPADSNETSLFGFNPCSLIAFLRGYNVSRLTRYNRYITLRFHF